MNRRANVFASVAAVVLALVVVSVIACATSLVVAGVWPWQLLIPDHVFVPPVVLGN